MEHEPPAEKPEETRAVRTKQASKIVGIVLAAVVPSLLAYFGAGVDAKQTAGEAAKDQAGKVEDKTRGVLYVSVVAIEEIRETIKALRENDIKMNAEIAALKRKTRSTVDPVKRREPVPSVVVPVPSAPLPTDLNQALILQQQQGKSEPAKP